MNRSKLHKGGKYVRLRQFKSFDVGVQVSYRVDSKIQTKKAVCNHTRELRAGNQETGSLPRMQGDGRAYDDRPRAYAHRGASEIFHCTGDGLYQGEKCGIRSTKVWR